MMNQIKFVWISKNVPGVKVNMGPDGITTVTLRPLIDITHDSKKRNRLEIIFKDTNTKYLIPDQKILKEIYAMHMSNIEVMLLLHQYCDQNLTLC